MIDPADNEINILLPVMGVFFLAVPVIIGVVIYKVFDLGSAIRRHDSGEPMSVMQALMCTVGGLILFIIGLVVLQVVIEIIRTAITRLAH